MKKTLLMLGLGATLAQGAFASSSSMDEAQGVTVVRTYSQDAIVWHDKQTKQTVSYEKLAHLHSVPGKIEVTFDAGRNPIHLTLQGSEAPVAGVRGHQSLSTAHMDALGKFLGDHKETLTGFHFTGYSVRDDLILALRGHLGSATLLSSLTLEENAISITGLTSLLALLPKVTSFALMDTSRFHDWPETFVPSLKDAVEGAPHLRHFSLAVPPLCQGSLASLVETLGTKKDIEVNLTFPSLSRSLYTSDLKERLGEGCKETNSVHLLTVCASPRRALD